MERKWIDRAGDFAHVPVPETEYRSQLNTFLVLSGALAVIAVIATGTTLGTQYNLNGLLIVVFSSVIILSILGGLLAIMGAITNLTTYVALRFSFGYIGSWFAGLVVSGIPSGIGWVAVEVWLFAIAVNTLFPGLILTNLGIAAIWGGFLMMTSALYGYKGLSILSYLAVPMFVLLSIAGFMVGLDATQSLKELFSLSPMNPAASITTGITALVGSYIVSTAFTMDITRYSENYYRAALAWIGQIVFILPIMAIGAGILALVTGQTDFAEILLSAGLGVAIFLIIIAGFWTTVDSALYAGALSWSMFLPFKKRPIVAMEGIIGTLIAAYVGFTAGASLDPFINFLNILGKVVPAVIGVMIFDFYIYRWWKKDSLQRRYEYEPNQSFGLIVWPGFVAFVLGAWIGGWILPIGISSVNSVLISGISYMVLMVSGEIIGFPTEIGTTQIDATGKSSKNIADKIEDKISASSQNQD